MHILSNLMKRLYVLSTMQNVEVDNSIQIPLGVRLYETMHFISSLGNCLNN